MKENFKDTSRKNLQRHTLVYVADAILGQKPENNFKHSDISLFQSVVPGKK